MDAERCWLRNGYKKGARGRYGSVEGHFAALLSNCNRGGIAATKRSQLSKLCSTYSQSKCNISATQASGRLFPIELACGFSSVLLRQRLLRKYHISIALNIFQAPYCVRLVN